MSINPDDYRFERKFYITELSYAEVQHILRHHPACLSEIFHYRFINNIYFDSHDYRYYFDNVDGAADRIKVRIRWYGDLFGKVKKPKLEFKIKKGLVGTKKSFKLQPFTFDETVTSEKIKAWLLESDVPDWVKEMFPSLTPSLVNRYGRKYFLSFDKRYRITIDDNVTFYQIHPVYNNFERKFIERETVIVELKYDQKNDAEAFSISKLFPYRMTKSSKYVNGVEKFFL